MFSSYVENPTHVRFEGQDEDEHIALLLRAHPITNLTWIIQAILLALLPVVLPPITLALGFEPNLPSTYTTAFLIINYLLILIITFEGFLKWYFNVYLLTNKRVVDITFHSLLLKNVDLAPLENIEETNSSTAGLLGTIFGFGDVAVQTAGANIAVDMKKVPSPSRVADMILDTAAKK